MVGLAFTLKTGGAMQRGGSSIPALPPQRAGGRIDLSSFPSTRYQGSKRKIVPWLWTYFRELDFTSALDVFGGTGSVSYLLKGMGKEVTYNDYLQFNHLIGTALIENDETNLTQDDIDAALGPVPNFSRRFVSDVFKGVYFTKKEN